MNDLDEAMLIAFVDGELDDVTRRRVERAVADDPALAERLAMHRRLRERLSGHYASIAAETVPLPMHATLEASAKVVPMARPARRWNWATGGAIAASLVIGLGVGHFSREQAGPIAVRGGAMVAQGALASALDTQLASAQGDGSTRIGLSFRRKGGGWCRSFEGAAVSGVACRQGDDWQVQAAVPGFGPETDYRQASSGDSRVMATVDALMEGDPANATGEAKARQAGWR